MALKAKFTRANVHQYLQKQSALIEAAIIRRLQYLGERCLVEARTNKTYKDQTGNLISSTGYVVVANGRIIDTKGFNQSLSANGGGAYSKEGALQGEQLAIEIARSFPTGYAMIMVAGMSYATYVEAMGLNVLSSAEHLAEKEMPKILKSLAAKIEKMNT